MDSCTLCGSAITGNYFRVRSKMSCAVCAGRITEDFNRNPTPFIIRGILFAFLGAIAGSLLRAAFEGLMSLAGAGGGALLGMSLRWFVFLMVAALIGGAAKAGSRGKSSVALQISSVAFYYLAVSLAFVPVLFSRGSRLHVTVPDVLGVSLFCLTLPFVSIARNPFNITGLIAIFFCMAAVWGMTAAAANPVDGPFRVEDPGVEPNFFKRKPPLTSIEKSGGEVSG